MRTIGRAVVVGGSMAGLAAAAHLARFASEVCIIERREARPGATLAPQGTQPHTLLMAGALVIEELFPGFADSLLERGADPGGEDRTRIPGWWYAAGSRRDHLSLPGNKAPIAICSRALIESRLRELTLALPNVSVIHDSAERLHLDPSGRAAGVHLRGGGLVHAPLVVDASGRMAPLVGTPEVPEPPRSEVVVDVRYTSFLLERRPGDFNGGSFAVVQNTRDIPRGGLALAHESGGWHVCLAGYFDDGAPADVTGAHSYARSLAEPVLAHLFDRPLLTEPRRYHFRSSLRRHWERVDHPVEGYVPVGDTVASFNPIYAQGMSSALLQARALGKEVAARGISPGLSRRMAKAGARAVAAPWVMATGGDFIYERTAGKRTPGQRIVNAYVDRVTRAAAEDETVNARLAQVTHLLAPPAALLHPRIVARVGRHGGRGRGSAVPTAPAPQATGRAS
jgi:2-polyprenyl-6-methoxyphenol hydroxylase-like FAD-dependent oxidoreductase